MSQPTRSEAIKNFLMSQARLELPQIGDLAEQYNLGMECQVNVAQDNGKKINGEFRGRSWAGFTDGLTTWKPIRIPHNAATVPIYEDREMSFDLAQHVEGIGWTGWDWQHRVSKLVAFDFDSIVGHSTGLHTAELEKIKQLASDIPWVTVRKSTSGRGIHLYVALPNVATMNHNEHAALARAVLAKMSAETGYDFNAKVDTCGGNMWLWHRKMKGTDGLTIIKQGIVLQDIPLNWHDHLSVVTRKRHKIKIKGEGLNEQEMEELANRRMYVPLDPNHLKIIKELEAMGGSWWDPDNNILVTHTKSLENLHERLSLRGVFRTISTTEAGSDWNCFCMPMHDGSWIVRRYTKHCMEDPSWSNDNGGWTFCFFNKHPDLASACRAFEGIEREKGGFLFREASVALEALTLLGTYLTLPSSMHARETLLKEHKDGRVITKVKREPSDDGGQMIGWEANKDGYWTMITNAPLKAPEETEIGNYDDLVRHLITEDGNDHGWVIKIAGKWVIEPLAHVKLILVSMGLSRYEIDSIVGNSIKSCWILVNRPFEPEYPGNRAWNRDSAQLRYLPKEDKENLHYAHWSMILNHCGSDLDKAVQANAWCRTNGIDTGADYLKCWIVSLIQEPNQPLPYLFFYGEQNCGKSILWEALQLLMTKGVMDASSAIKSNNDFNAELEGALLCIIEEINLRRNQEAYTKIKQWVTAITMSIHRKQMTPYMTNNKTHWMHFANDQDACPVFPGDTRVVVIHVPPLDLIDLIPKKQLLEELAKEASDFITELLTIELPPSNDRLNIPPIVTDAKVELQQANETELQTFLREQCYYVEGCIITIEDFYEEFVKTLDAVQINKWSKIRIGKEIPRDKFPKGRRRRDAHWCYGNISFEQKPHIGKKVLRDPASEFLVE